MAIQEKFQPEPKETPPQDTSVPYSSAPATGSGAALTDLNASELTSGTVDKARLPATMNSTTFNNNVVATDNNAQVKLNGATGGVELSSPSGGTTATIVPDSSGNVTFNHNVIASLFTGSGAGLTGIVDAALTSNIARLATTQTWTADQTRQMVIADATSVPQFAFQRRGTTGDSTAAVSGTTPLLAITASGWNGTSYTIGGKIQFDAFDTFSSSQSGTKFRLFVVDSTTNTLSERMNIIGSVGSVACSWSPTADLGRTLGTSTIRWTTLFSGGIATNIVSKTSAYTPATNDCVIEYDATSGAITNTLPTPSASNKGCVWVLRKIDSSANAVNFTGTVDATVNPSLSAQWHTMIIYSTGSVLRFKKSPSAP